MSNYNEAPLDLILTRPGRNRLVAIQQSVESMRFQGTEDPSVACKPHLMVPFPPDSDFVHRPDIWTWITENYDGPANRLALVGMGGFGYDMRAAVSNTG